MLQYILRSTLLTRITLQYYWDKYITSGSKRLCLPQGNLHGKKKEKLFKLKLHN